MNIVYSIYWIITFSLIILSIITIIRKKYINGITNLLLSLMTPYFTSVYVISSIYLNPQPNEITYIINGLKKTDLGAYTVVLITILLIVMSVFNIIDFFKSKNQK